MRAEIVMIGTELLIGQITDTNAQYLAQTLAENGINIYQKTTVGDNRERLIAALDGALNRADVVLCSGGLGPTEDDITRECVGELLGRPLVFREDIYASLLSRFAHLRHLITDNNKKQATLPEGTVAIENPRGTAPGLLAESERGVIICMPGVPHELKGMMEEQVLPYLRANFGPAGVLHYRVLKVCGVGESRVDDLIGDIIRSHTNPSIGLLANPEAVRIRIAARAETEAAAETLIAPVAEAIAERLPGLVMGQNEDTLEAVLDSHFAARGWKLAVLETGTGGMIAQRLVAAEARCFAGGQVRAQWVGEAVPETALDLAKGLLLDSDVLCALVLLASASEPKSSGAFICPDGTATFEIGHIGTGARSQLRTSVVALEQVRRLLTGAAAWA